MRPAGRGPLESLYFTYPHFAPPAAPPRGDAKVAIVGAGPVGLTAALALARHGIASVVFDRKDTFNDGSRAICIARASMHILERAGAVAPFLEKALGWTHGTSFWRGLPVYRLAMPHGPDDKYLPMYNLQQQHIEQFLWQAAAANPLIELRWQSEATAIGQDAQGATLRIATPAGEAEHRFEWVLAADGARSALRRLMGLRLAGANHEGRYVIADIRMAHDHPTERRALFDPPGNPGGTVLIHRQPDDIWRIDYQLRAGEDPEAAVAEAEIRRRVQAILQDIGHDGAWELEWWSIYTANTLCLDAYRHGRVAFIGDAAHIVPIFGVRGLNNGLADAENIAWKLAYRLRGEAAEALLDSYTPERRGATLDVFANAVPATRFMTPPSRGWALLREAALSLAVRHDFARGFANPRQMQPYTYAESPLTLPAGGPGPVPGALAPNLRLENGHLLDGAGPGFTLLAFAPVPDGLAARLRALDPRLVVLSQPPDGAASSRYGGGACLLRPDLHIAARWPAIDADAIAATLRRILGGGA
jgi:3-(3-hydroxy-phenyl)propionate hydroxylase